MNRPLAIRAVCLYLPLAATAAAWLWRKPGRRERGAALLAGAWNLPALLALHLVAVRQGWWSFHAQGGLLQGLPVDLYLGWALLWGPAAALASPVLSLAGVLALAAAFDLVLMPAARPVVVLGPGWLLGEAAGLLFALVPAQFLARWTREQRRLRTRAVLQVILFAGLGGFVLPAVVAEQTGQSLASLLTVRGWGLRLAIPLTIAAAMPGLSAVQEFCARGRGTPLPYDPPRHLVVSGVYAYVANPMQCSMALVFLTLGIGLSSPWIASLSIIAVAYSAGFAAWHENAETGVRFGESWRHYRAHVDAWLPRWRPWIASPSTLFVGETCGACSEIGAWLKRRRPVGLGILAAEDHPTRDLTRITYESSDGTVEEGISAFARALEHVHLAWALIGWTSRLPVIRTVLQVALDASGGGPRLVRRRALEHIGGAS